MLSQVIIITHSYPQLSFSNCYSPVFSNPLPLYQPISFLVPLHSHLSINYSFCMFILFYSHYLTCPAYLKCLILIILITFNSWRIYQSSFLCCFLHSHFQKQDHIFSLVPFSQFSLILVIIFFNVKIFCEL